MRTKIKSSSYRIRAFVCVISALLSSASSIISAEEGNLNIGVRVGNDTGEAFLSLFAPLYLGENTLLFLNPRGSLRDEGETEGNVGVGFRHLLGENGAIFGANVYYDHRKSKFDNKWSQWGAGLEFLSNWVDARFNYYQPEDRSVLINQGSLQTVSIESSTSIETFNRYASTTTREQTGFSSVSSAANVAFAGNGLVGDITTQNSTQLRDTSTRTVWTTTKQTTTTNTTTTDMFFEQYEGGLEGWDAEMGLKMPTPETMPEVRVFAGYYNFDKPYGGEIKGMKGRLEVRTGPYFTLDAELFDDEELNDTRWFLGARLRLPFDVAKIFSGQNPFGARKNTLADYRNRTLRSRFTEDVIRDVRIQTGESEFAENRNLRRAKTDVEQNVQDQMVMQSSTTVEQFSVNSMTQGTGSITQAGSAVTVVHIDDNNAGDPQNDAGATAGTYENPHTTVAAANADPLDARVILIHGGSTVTDANVQVDSDDSLYGEGGGVVNSISTDQGTVVLPETAPGAQVGVVPTISGVDISSSNVMVSNLTVANGSIATLPGAAHSNLTIQNITINGSAAGRDAIELGEYGVLGDSTVGGAIILNNITVNGSDENGIDINNVLAGATITGNNISVTGAGDDGLDIDDIASGAVFNFNNINLMASVEEGLIFSDADGMFTFNNLDVDNTGLDGIVIADSSGTFSFDDNSSVKNAGIDSFVAVGGAPDITYTGILDHQGADHVVHIIGTGAGSDIVFNSAQANAIINTVGDGIIIDSVDGNVSFLAHTVLNGNEGVGVGGSTGTFTFSNTDINVSGGGGFGLQGALELYENTGATVNFGANSSITQTTDYLAVNVDSFGFGDSSTLIFDGDIAASHGDGLSFITADGNYQFNGTTTLDGTANVAATGITISDTIGGTFNFGSNTSIVSPTGIAFNANDGGNFFDGATITYNGTITQNNAFSAVEIDGATAASVITFGGLVTANTSTATAVNLVNISNATVSFNGGLNTTTTSGTAVNVLGDGTINIDGGSIAAPTTAGSSTINVSNTGSASPLTLNLTDVTATGARGNAAVEVTGQSAAVPVNVNLVNTNVQGGDHSGAQGGGAGITASNASITLDSTSSATGGAGIVSEGGGAGIGGSGGVAGAVGEAFGANVTVNNEGTVTGGASTTGGGGAGIGGGGGGTTSAAGGSGAGATNTGGGTQTGGIGSGGARDGAAIGDGG